MKISAMTFLGITSVVLFTLIIFVTMNLPFSWVFFLTVAGQILFGITVYKILRDDYTTEKEFDDFYEDHPVR